MDLRELISLAGHLKSEQKTVGGHRVLFVTKDIGYFGMNTHFMGHAGGHNSLPTLLIYKAKGGNP